MDEEVIYKEQDSNLYYIDYKIKNSKEVITIATTRPETILGDTAVCVHPEDLRYQHIIWKKVLVQNIAYHTLVSGRRFNCQENNYKKFSCK